MSLSSIIRLVFTLSIFFPVCFPVEQARAQSATATLFGRVVDQAGAFLPGVQIRITKEETSISRTGTTGPEGRFVFPLMNPGTYSAVAVLRGFQTGIIKGIWLNVGEIASVEFELKVGSTQEEITVVAARTLVEVETAERGSIVQGEEILSLHSTRHGQVGCKQEG